MTARVYRLKVTYPEMPAPGWVESELFEGWEPEGWEADPRNFEGEQAFYWPPVRNFLSLNGARWRADLIEKYGATVVIEASEPVVWATESGPGLCQVLDYEIGKHLCQKREGGGAQCELKPRHKGNCWISEHTIRHSIAGNGYHCGAIEPAVEVGHLTLTRDVVTRSTEADRG
ncbi:hypothetical protein [Kineosporia babensis]|uniref:Uncharacterized protein n=1 Tax=Kineosporia babensis TaxID=499548 RepID=A0A9X1N9M3_9ACTN|nr:hypothetical protein [Kineosporia babensis]MCD5310927.1 hypothetical protein [Kineosporia babensis]